MPSSANSQTILVTTKLTMSTSGPQSGATNRFLPSSSSLYSRLMELAVRSSDSKLELAASQLGDTLVKVLTVLEGGKGKLTNKYVIL